MEVEILSQKSKTREALRNKKQFRASSLKLSNNIVKIYKVFALENDLQTFRN